MFLFAKNASTRIEDLFGIVVRLKPNSAETEFLHILPDFFSFWIVNAYCHYLSSFADVLWTWYALLLPHNLLVASMLCGGVSSAPVDEKVKKMVADFKGEVESRLNEQFTTFNPIEATHQVVRR